MGVRAALLALRCGLSACPKRWRIELLRPAEGWVRARAVVWRPAHHDCLLLAAAEAPFEEQVDARRCDPARASQRLRQARRWPLDGVFGDHGWAARHRQWITDLLDMGDLGQDAQGGQGTFWSSRTRSRSKISIMD